MSPRRFPLRPWRAKRAAGQRGAAKPPPGLMSQVSCPRAGSHLARDGPRARPVKGPRRSLTRSHVSGLMSPRRFPLRLWRAKRAAGQRPAAKPPPGLMSQVSCPRAGSHFARGGPSARQVKGWVRPETRDLRPGETLRHRDIEICGPPLRAPLTFARIRPVSSWAGPSKEARGDPVPFWIERKNE